MRKRYSTRQIFNLVSAAFAVSLAPMFTLPVGAADNIVSSAETAASTLYTLTDTDSLTVTNTGEVNATGGANTAVEVDSSATGVTINNSGTISNDGGYAIYIDSASDDTSITNQAGANISAPTTAIHYDGELDGSLTNAGTITITDPTSGSYNGIYVSGDVSGTISNSGLISVEGTTGYSNTYYGIDIWGSLTGTLTNSGTIRLSATATDDIYLRGIYVGDIGATGTLTNSGTIDISGLNTDDTQTNIGINVDGVMAGTLNNTGTITVSSTVDYSSSSDNYAYGIYINDELSGTLTNSGSISATAISGYDYSNQAYGIYVNGDLSGPLTNTNTGTITASASNYNRFMGSYATAYGIYIDGDVSSTLTNDGTITANASNSYYSAYAYGIYVSNNVTGTVSNNGTIDVTADADGGEDATAYGIYVGNDVTGAVTNNGTIQITASASSSDVYAATGIYISGDVSAAGSVTNTGNITVNVLAADDYAYGAGINVNNDMQGTLLNSGNITLNVTMDGYDEYDDYGIYLDTLSGTMTNSGNITVSQTVGSSDTDGAYGVYIGTLTGTLNNSGTISSTGTGTSYMAYPVGLHVDTLDAAGTINNSGTISATGVSSASARAVEIGTLNGTFSNSGTISASDESGYAYSIWASAGSGSVVNSGTISGDIRLGGTISMTNTGTLSIPTGETGTIGGDYTQNGNGVLKVGATSSATYAKLTVNGTADISANNKVTVDVNANETLADGDILTSVISAGTLTTNGASFSVNDNSLAWQFTAANDGTDLDLTATETGLTTFQAVVQSTGLNTGTGVAGTLDTLINGTPTGDMEVAINALGGLGTAGEVSAAVSQLTPLMNGGIPQATANSIQGADRAVQARLDAKRGLSSGDPVMVDRKVWLKPFGSWAKQDDRNNVAGYDADSFGLALGADAEKSPETRLGLAFAYAQTDVDGNSATAPQNADIKTYQAIFYGSNSINDRTNLDFQADIATNNNEGERTINFGGLNRVAKSDYDSLAIHLGAGVSNLVDVKGKATFLTSIGLDYTSIMDDGYTETGAGALNLVVDSNTTESLVLGVDGKYNHALTDTMTLAGNLGVGYDFLSEESSIGAAFVGGGAAFTTNGLDPSPWIISGGLGLEMFHTNGVDIIARYDVEGRDDFINHTASVKFKMSF